jgi:hypothetical protein
VSLPVRNRSTVCTAPFHRASHSTANQPGVLDTLLRVQRNTLLRCSGQLRVRCGCTNADSGIARTTLWPRQTDMGSHAAVGASYMATWRLELPTALTGDVWVSSCDETQKHHRMLWEAVRGRREPSPHIDYIHTSCCGGWLLRSDDSQNGLAFGPLLRSTSHLQTILLHTG